MFDFTAEQEEFRQSLKHFVQEEVSPIAAKVDRDDEIPWELRRKIAAFGLNGTIVPQEQGGKGWGQVELCIQEEELAYGSPSIASSTLASTLCQTPFYLVGTKEQQERFMVPIAKGEAVGSFGLSEPGYGSDFASIVSTARKEGDGYVLNGTKRWIDNTTVSEYFMVWVKTDTEIRPKHKGISTFVFTRDDEGFEVDQIDDLIGLRGLGVGGFTFKELRVPKENMLGPEGEGFYIAMKLLERGRTPTAAICVGLCQAALDDAIAFAKKRIAFGKPIAQHQMIQQKLADMAAYTDAARLLTYRAAYKIDQGGRCDKEASMAKYVSALAAMFVTREAVQIHGARGCTKDFRVERMSRDARIFTIGEGTLEIQRQIVAKRLCED
jgi:butyryl-CoA dehydrogenase